MSRRTTGEGVDLVAAYWTIAGVVPESAPTHSPFDIRDRIEAAARAGFKGIGLVSQDLEHVLESRSLAEVRRLLEDNGILHVELEFLTDWFLHGDRRKHSDVLRSRLLAGAEALGARCIKVGDFFAEKCSMPRLIDSFGRLCEEAARAGTRIAFEPMACAMIHTLPDSLAMVNGAGAENGGIILDIWHVVNLGFRQEDMVRIPSERLIGVELNDAPIVRRDATRTEAGVPRRYCGEGEFDIPGFITTIRTTGFRGPWGVEVISEQLLHEPLDGLARRAFTTTMAQFETGP